MSSTGDHHRCPSASQAGPTHQRLAEGLAPSRRSPSDDGPPTEPVEVAVASIGVDADAVLIDRTWGTEIILTATGPVPGAVYRTEANERA